MTQNSGVNYTNNSTNYYGNYRKDYLSTNNSNDKYKDEPVLVKIKSILEQFKQCNIYVPQNIEIIVAFPGDEYCKRIERIDPDGIAATIMLKSLSNTPAANNNKNIFRIQMIFKQKILKKHPIIVGSIIYHELCHAIEMEKDIGTLTEQKIESNNTNCGTKAKDTLIGSVEYIEGKRTDIQSKEQKEILATINQINYIRVFADLMSDVLSQEEVDAIVKYLWSRVDIVIDLASKMKDSERIQCWDATPEIIKVLFIEDRSPEFKRK